MWLVRAKERCRKVLQGVGQGPHVALSLRFFVTRKESEPEPRRQNQVTARKAFGWRRRGKPKKNSEMAGGRYFSINPVILAYRSKQQFFFRCEAVNIQLDNTRLEG